MNVLYASMRYPPPALGGGETHLHCIAERLARRGHGVRVVSQESRWRKCGWLRSATTRCHPPERYVHEGVPVERLGFDRLTRLRMWPWTAVYRHKPLRGRAIRPIAGLMRPYFGAAASAPVREGSASSAPAGATIDVVHAIRIGCEFLARVALDHARSTGVPFVITALQHPDWTAPKHEHYARIFREADAVVALTDHEKRILVDDHGVPENRVHVTGIGPVVATSAPVDAFRERHGLRNPYVLFVGRKADYKGWRAILASAPTVRERVPEVEFVFLGEDTAASRAAFERQRASGGGIRNLGPVDLETKTAALAGCELLCLPSTSESFGGVFTEAWTFGKPVIGGRIPTTAQVIDDGVDGLLSSQDPAELAESMTRLLLRPEDARRMGEAGRRKVEQRYSWDRLVQATLRIYDSVLGGRAAPSGEPQATG